MYRSDDPNSVENFRPISVLPVLSKLLENVVHSQLSDYLEKEQLLNDSQFGYRKNRSTHLATTLLVDEIREAGDNGMLTGALFLDLSKAFDTINHNLILKKLMSYGVRCSELNWFTDYLFLRSQVVGVSNQKSSRFYLSSGVPQSSILGPYCCLLYSLTTFPSKCIQYADDTIIYHADKNVNIIENVLNEEIKKLPNYFYEN